MKTGCLFTARGPGVIAVSRSVPKFLAGKVRRFEALAPDRRWHHLAKPAFCRAYFGYLLARLDAREVWNSLHEIADGHEPVLSCYERLQKEEEWCHRSMIAAWFKRELGEAVDELEPTPPAPPRQRDLFTTGGAN
jgi:Protein of unknown function, DUF488